VVSTEESRSFPVRFTGRTRTDSRVARVDPTDARNGIKAEKPP
jgi:hypothetical protein